MRKLTPTDPAREINTSPDLTMYFSISLGSSVQYGTDDQSTEPDVISVVRSNLSLPFSALAFVVHPY
jgi:hypothetical protein